MKASCGHSRFLIALFASIQCVAGCIIIFPSYSTGPAFQVRVEDRGQPVLGLRLDLKGGRFSKSAETGPGGFAQFRNIPPGKYVVSAKLEAGMPSGADIDVRAQGPNNTTISLAWPNRSPLLVTALEGILRWPAIEADPNESTLQIELLNARTGRSLKTMRSSRNGGFDLGKTEPGLYILRASRTDLAIERGERLSGNILVEVDPLAAKFELDLEIGWTSCGLMYVERHTCPQENLSIETLSGQVLDPSGASIAGATISLYTPDRVIVDQRISDEQGYFESPKQLKGTYELIVSRSGFTPLRRSVNASGSKDEDLPTALGIKLGIAGACSSARLASPLPQRP
jgi:hypothetical protein